MSIRTIIFFPIIHLVIEYLDISKNCICYDHCNDLLSFALINKEMYRYVNQFNLLKPTRVLYFSINKTFIKDYFKLHNICLRHHLLNDVSLLQHIIKLLKNINNQINSKNNNSIDWMEFNRMIFNENEEDINKKKIIDYIHCENISACKEFINKYCCNLRTRYTCCGGTGLSVEIYMD